jgi:DNA-binding beta-propeller fold protein YncE
MLRWDQQGIPASLDFPATHLSDVAYDGNRLWVTKSEKGKGFVVTFDPLTGKWGEPIEVGIDPAGVLFDGQHIWVANRGSKSLSCIDLTKEKSVATTWELKNSEELTADSPYYLAFDGEHIWVTDRDANAVWRLPADSCDRPTTDYTDTRITKINGMDFSQPLGIIFDGTYIWVANRGSNVVIRLDPGQCDTEKCEKARIIPVGDQGSQPSNLAYDGKYVWVTLQGTDQVARIEAETSWVIEPFIDVGRQPWGIAYDGTYIWVANNWDESVSRLRTADGALVETFETGGAASRFAFDGTFMWITNFGDDEESSFLTRR